MVRRWQGEPPVRCGVDKERSHRVVHESVANPQRRRSKPQISALEPGYVRKCSGVRRAAPDEEVKRLYRQLRDGSLDLSPPSVPPFVDSLDDDGPVTERFEVPSETTPAAMHDRGVLLRVEGANSGQIHGLDKPELVIGRGGSADVRLADEGASRRHALLMHSRGHYFLQDLDSSNGTFLDGRRVRRAPLMEGDLIRLGPVATFRFCMMDEKQERALTKLFEESTADPLTGLGNGRFFDARLRQELAFAVRHATDLAVALLEVKLVSTGHPAPVAPGDVVVARVAHILSKALRTEDVLARLGDNQFGLLLRGTELREARHVIDRMQDAVLAASHAGLGLVGARLGAGCSSLRTCDAPTREALLAGANARRTEETEQRRSMASGS